MYLVQNNMLFIALKKSPQPTTLVTRVGKKSFYTHFAPPHLCAMLTKHFHLTQVFIFITIFQHWKGEWGCWHLFCRYYDCNFLCLAFSNTICPRLSEFPYALNAHNLHWDLHIQTKYGTCTIYHLLNKMTAHIWLLPNSLPWFADFVFPQNWGFQRFYVL